MIFEFLEIQHIIGIHHSQIHFFSIQIPYRLNWHDSV